MENSMVVAVPCPKATRGGDGELVHCGRNCLPGQLFCRKHGGSSAEVVTRASSDVRLEIARGQIQAELSGGIVSAVALYLAVVEDEMQKTADRLSAADRLIALSGGVEALRSDPEAEGEMSGPQAQLAELLAASSDDRVARLAFRLGVGEEPGAVAPELRVEEPEVEVVEGGVVEVTSEEFPGVRAEVGDPFAEGVNL